ncbi:unnamed protein product [Pleuronectes platessa]|uniref:Uncharacterized protein n=1 Tax=Pleuronectes platessa TaxID=8262 RepID=A0A9N7VAV5_PLEPL|nr:unnamed protein product [Pleuronectes platessa]
MGTLLQPPNHCDDLEEDSLTIRSVSLFFSSTPSSSVPPSLFPFQSSSALAHGLIYMTGVKTIATPSGGWELWGRDFIGVTTFSFLGNVKVAHIQETPRLATINSRGRPWREDFSR